MKTVALVDPLWEGHHPAYLKLFAKTLLSLGNRVMIFCPNSGEMENWLEVNCPEHQGSFKAWKIADFGESRVPVASVRSIITTFRNWKAVAKGIQEALRESGWMPDIVFFAWLDSYLNVFLPVPIIDRIFRLRWAGLYFHPVHLRLSGLICSTGRWLLDPGHLLSSHYCKAVAVLDEGIAGLLQERTGRRPVVVFPDIADSTAPDSLYCVANEIRQTARGRKIIGLIGSLEKRKGILMLLALAQRAAADDLLFVFCGKLCEDSFAPEELNYLNDVVSSSPLNCYFYFSYIADDAQFNSLIAVCDVLFAVYENFYHSSNILTKAATFRKPVLVQKGSCMEERVKRFNTGLSVDSGDVSQCEEAIRILLSDGCSSRPDYDGLFELHSTERLSGAFESILDSLK